MWIKNILFALSACTLQAIGQTHLPDMTLERDFAAQVKSVDEFIARFNGDESKPGIKADSVRTVVEKTSTQRSDNIISLFDFKMSHEGLDDNMFKKRILDFTRTAVSWDRKLSLQALGTIAEASCLIKYGGKQYTITIFLKRDSTERGNNKWGMAGVRGLEKLGLFNSKRVTISPVDHETHFMSLQDFFQSNRNLVPSLRANDKEIEQMSFLFGLCVAKAINFICVDRLKFHFMDMPLYNFVVEEKGREGTNSGWLITKIIDTPNDNEKKKYYIELFGNK